MRILNLQNAVLVSLAVATVALAACSSSDTPRPGSDTAGTGNTSAGSGNNGTAGGDVITPGAGSGNTTAGGGDQGSGAGAPPAGGMGSSMAGSGTAGGGTTGPSVCDGLGTRILAAMPADAFIDDFECKTAACTAPKTVADGWSAFNDLGMPGVDAADNMINMLGIMPGAATTAHGGQYKGTGANVSTKSPGFGVGAIYNLVIDPTAGIYCADISAFDGVSFWAKTGIAAGSTVSVNFALPNTNAEVMNADGKEAGGDCKTGCYNHPHKLVTLSADWMQYTVAFADAAGGSAKVKNLVQLLGFLSPDAAWDFSLDEIAFYKTTPPAGAVAPPAAAAP
jgi:hypothetical protein